MGCVFLALTWLVLYTSTHTSTHTPVSVCVCVCVCNLGFNLLQDTRQQHLPFEKKFKFNLRQVKNVSYCAKFSHLKIHTCMETYEDFYLLNMFQHKNTITQMCANVIRFYLVMHVVYVL